MTRDELLTMMRDVETQLRSAAVQAFFQKQPEDIRKRFVSFRQEISVLVGRLTNAQLSDIAAKLDELSPDLKAGIDDLKGKIDTLNSAIAILNLLGNALGLAARVAACIVAH